ncbi:hypothetical protein [Solimonas soli]|uniref:hypothetical protein n=1 Tax=Solimonas soli TaxID=413479 RepID=UPI000481EBB2|nr:hypothetical protein [Solimonas soli]
MDPKPWQVRNGEIIAQRIFEIAYSIDLSRLQAQWQQKTGAPGRRSGFSKTPPKAVAFDVPPLLLELEPVSLTLARETVPLSVRVRIYDFGVISLSLRAEVQERGWRDFAALLNDIDQAVGPASGAELWDRLLMQVKTLAADACERPMHSTLQEDYLYGIVRAFDAPPPVATLADDPALVFLLSGEQRPLSEFARRELLRQRYSYYEDDLVVLTWDRAFIYEPRGDTDVADVLETANAQLLEMRYYDELLDGELPRIYDLVEATQRTLLPRAPARYARLARRLHGLVAEVTELKEKVDNALQVTEDVYLARIYSAALEQLRVPAFSQAVDRKLAIVRDTYIALYDEASSRRAELLEITIIALIALELVLALLR